MVQQKACFKGFTELTSGASNRHHELKRFYTRNECETILMQSFWTFMSSIPLNKEVYDFKRVLLFKCTKSSKMQGHLIINSVHFLSLASRGFEWQSCE
jgi:hypothetical protein